MRKLLWVTLGAIALVSLLVCQIVGAEVGTDEEYQ